MTDSERSTRSRLDGFGLASLVAGSVALFFADRIFPPFGRDIWYLLIVLLLPAAGVAFGYVALTRRVAEPRDRQFAVAGALLSAVAALIIILLYATRSTLLGS